MTKRRQILLDEFKSECQKIEDETGHAVRVDDRSFYNEGEFVDAVHIAIYPTKARYGIPIKCGAIYNFGRVMGVAA